MNALDARAMRAFELGRGATAWLDPLFLNQNLRAVHHLFPYLPWYRYRAALAVLAPDLRRAGVPQWGWREALAKLAPGPLPS
jgi:fatty acid desaturase